MGEAETYQQEVKGITLKTLIDCVSHNSAEEFALHQEVDEKKGRLIGGILEITIGDKLFTDFSIHGKITDIKSFGTTTKLNYVIPGSTDVQEISIGSEGIKYRETYYVKHTVDKIIRKKEMHFRIYNEAK